MLTNTDTMTLSTVLQAIGWTYCRPANSNLQGNQVFDARGNDMGVLQAHECWDKLRRLNLIR